MRLDHDKYPAPCPEATPTFEAETTPTFEAYQLSCKIAASKHQNDAFLLANEDQLIANCTQMAQDFPQIQPYFDVSCNTCPWLLESLANFNIKFRCQSKAEIQHLLNLSIDGANMIFANPTKVGSHIKLALAHQVELISYGSFAELKKIQKAAFGSVNPENVGLLLELQNPCGNPELDRQWLDLLNGAKESGFNVRGVSFESGMALNKRMALTKMAFTIGRSLGHDMKVIDLGLMNDLNKEELKVMVDKHLKDVEHQIIGQLGASFIENVFTSSAKIIGKRQSRSPNSNSTLIINDGIFGNFGRFMIDEDFNLNKIKSMCNKNRGSANSAFDIYGSSGDDMDEIGQNFILDQEVQENDWLFFENMGAFSITLSTEMDSLKLPAKFGNFRMFTKKRIEMEEFEFPATINSNDHVIKRLEMENRGIEDGLEVIFLDIQELEETSNFSNTCLDLLEAAFPSIANCQNGQFWEDFYTNLR